jgi:hypothetical protein
MKITEVEASDLDPDVLDRWAVGERPRSVPA